MEPAEHGGRRSDWPAWQALVRHQARIAAKTLRAWFAEEPDRAEVLAQSVAGLLPAIVFAASIPIAYLVSPKAAALSWPTLLVLAPLAPRLAARAA